MAVDLLETAAGPLEIRILRQEIDASTLEIASYFLEMTTLPLEMDV